MTGSEHRRALPFFPFAVVATIGSVQNETDHLLLTRAVCGLVAVTNEIFAERCTGGGITGAQAAAVAERAQKWVIDYYQPSLGPSHTTKLHRLAVHLLDEFRLRGNFFDGNTVYNERLQKPVKSAYEATNKRRDQFVEQVLLNQQVAALLLEEEERPIAAVSAATPAHAGRRSRPLRFSHRCTAEQPARKRKLPGLCTVLEVEHSASLFYCDSVYYGKSSAPRRGRVANTIRAAASFHGASWYDWLQYRGPIANRVYCQAALVVQSRTGRRKRLVVRRAEEAAPREGCVLTDYGCQRLQWAVPSGGNAARLDVVEVTDIVGWVAVEHDWEDLCERHGVLFMPNEVPSTAAELRAARYFVNAFAVSDAGEETDDE